MTKPNDDEVNRYRQIYKTSSEKVSKKILIFFTLGFLLVGISQIEFDDTTEADHFQLVYQAGELYKNKQFKEALRILDEIPSSSPLNTEVDRMRSLIKRIKAMPSDEQGAYYAEIQKQNLIESEERASRELQQTKMLLNTELSLIAKKDFEEFRKTGFGLQKILEMFDSWQSLIKRAEQTNDLELTRIAKKFKSKVSKFQAVEFPRMRKAHAKLLNDLFWKEDMKVWVSGSKNQIINISGWQLLRNKNKAQLHQDFKSTFQQLRFEKARYMKYEGAEYSYWDLEPEKDSDLYQKGF